MPTNPAVLAAAMAVSSLLAAPVAAADIGLPQQRDARVMTGDAGVQAHDRWRRHRRGGVDAGDVIAGIFVLGALAAVIDAAGNDRERDRDRRRYDDRAPPRETGWRENDYGSRGLNNAADMCVAEIERGSERVGHVSDAARGVDGWRVSGALDNGAGWQCWIDNAGRIRSIDLGDLADAGTGDTDASQWSDADYARARAGTQTPADAYAYDAAGDQPQPAYPGGPLPGEEGYEEAMAAAAAR